MSPSVHPTRHKTRFVFSLCFLLAVESVATLTQLPVLKNVMSNVNIIVNFGRVLAQEGSAQGVFLALCQGQY